MLIITDWKKHQHWQLYMVVSVLVTFAVSRQVLPALELKSLFFPHILSTNAAVCSKNSNSLSQLIAMDNYRQFAAQEICRHEGHWPLPLAVILLQVVRADPPLSLLFLLWHFVSKLNMSAQLFLCHVMNDIQAQIWLKNILLHSWDYAVGPAKMTEGFRNGHYNVDHKASLLFLLRACMLKGFISWAHHCSVTSCKDFHSECWRTLAKWQQAHLSGRCCCSLRGARWCAAPTERCLVDASSKAALAGFPTQLGVADPADPSQPVSSLTACLMRGSVIVWKIGYSFPINRSLRFWVICLWFFLQ